MNNLYLGSGLWKRNDWFNHGSTKSLWYNALLKHRISKNTGEFNENDFKYDYDVDLSDFNKFPIENNKLKLIYTSHMIEHLTNNDVQKVFTEAYRMLEKDGVFRITCPDVDILYENLIENKNITEDQNNSIDVFGFYGCDKTKLTGIDKFLYSQFSYFSKYYKIKDTNLIEDMNIYDEFLSIDKIDNDEFIKLLDSKGKYNLFEYLRERSEKYYSKFRYQLTGLHTNWWNKNKVIEFLKKAKFETIYIRTQHISINDEFKSGCFDTTCPGISLFIEAIK